MFYKKMIKTLLYSLIIILSLALVFLINGYFEVVIVNNRINNFKERGVYQYTDDYIKTYYYKVPKIYEYEDISRNIFDFDNRWIGSKTDIIITNRNPMRDNPTLAGIIGFLSTNFYVGHATINSNDSGSRMYEVVGNYSEPEDNVVRESFNSWLTVEEALQDAGDSPMIIGLRIKGTTEEDRDKMIEYAENQEGKPYNFSFLFNRHKSFYCTDLVSRSTRSAGINVNYDYLATTGNDIIVSPNVYIIFIRETIVEDGVKKYNIYYLDDK